MKQLVCILLVWQCVSCQHKPNSKAVALVKQANEIGFATLNKDTLKINQALDLLDQAIKIDDQYFSAYYTKEILLASKKDIDGSLSINEKLIALRPNQPSWIVQRGLFYDIKGNTSKAKENYRAALAKYQDLLKQQELHQDFNFRMEYVTALEASEDLVQAKKEMDQLKKDFPDNEIVQEFCKIYKLKSKAELIKLWKYSEQDETSTSPQNKR
jgi:tetratricopeptide (TPR) repeat protein